MKSTTFSIATLALLTSSLAAYVPSEPWSTLTPDGKLEQPHTTDYTKTFAISIDPIATTVTTNHKLVKRDVVTQIGDGQIQATTATTTDKPKKTNAPVVTQIGDGQIQATTATTTEKPKTKATVVTQIGDGQIQATSAAPVPVCEAPPQPVTQIGDGQIQGAIQTNTPNTGKTPVHDYDFPQSCNSPNALSMTLHSGVLTDAHGRIGSIVQYRQFQFDGPPPQAGAIYAAGWSVTSDGNLALGNSTVFYQCLSGDFYNLYDEHIGNVCDPVHLKIIDLIDC